MRHVLDDLIEAHQGNVTTRCIIYEEVLLKDGLACIAEDTLWFEDGQRVKGKGKRRVNPTRGLRRSITSTAMLLLICSNSMMMR